MRSSACSTSNRNVASALVSSVLPTPVGPQEHERADRPVRVLQAGAGAPGRGGNRVHGLRLADDPLGEIVLHAQQLVALAFQHLVDRDAGPARDDLGDMVGRHRLLHHVAGGPLLLVRRLELALQIGDAAVGEFAGLGEIALALRLVEVGAGLVERLLDLVGGGELFLLGHPALGKRVRLLLEVGQLLLQPRQPVLRGGVGLLAERLALDLQLHDAAVELVERLGLGIDLHAEPRGGLVHQVDGLVGQEAIGDVAVRERRRGDHRRVGDPDAVVQLVLLLEAAQDRDGVLDRGLRDEDRLEAAGKCCVLLDVLAVLVQRGGADAVQVAAGERRLQQVGGIHGAVRLAGADEGVHLVDEQDDIAFGGRDLVQHRLQPLLELAAVLGAGDEGAEVERQQLLVLQALRHVAIDDPEGQPFGDRRLADAGLADEHGIVLRAAREHLDGAADLLVAADDRIELAVARGLGEVAGVFLERVILALGGSRIGGAAFPDFLDGGIQGLRRDAGVGQNFRGARVLLHGEREQQPLDRHKRIAGLLGDLLGGVENLGGGRGHVELAVAAAHLGNGGERPLGGGERVARPAPCPLDQAGGQPLGVVEQHLQDVLRRELLVAGAKRPGLGGLRETARPLGVLVEVHCRSLSRLKPAVRLRGPAGLFPCAAEPGGVGPHTGGPSRNKWGAPAPRKRGGAPQNPAS